MPDIFTPEEQSNQKKQFDKPKVEIPPPSPKSTADHAMAVEPEKTIAEPPSAVKEAVEKTGEPQGKPIGLLSAFCMYPKGLSFANQEKDERILLFLRRHFITNIPWIVTTFLLFLLPPVIFALFAFSNFSLFTIPPQVVIVLLAFYYLTILNYALVRFIMWFYHVGIVTPKRMLDLDVNNILFLHLAETNILDIVDVSYSQRGFLQSFFDYGDIPIQTEAIKANFEFEAAPKPSVVSDLITDLRPKTAHHHEHEKGGQHHA